MSHTAIIRLPDRLDGWPGMSIIVPLHKWRSADPVILIGRRRPSGTRERQGLRLPGPHACRVP